MEKNLISEVSRIHKLMGINESGESTSDKWCPFCDAIIKQVDEIAEFSKKTGVNSRVINLKINEVLERVKNNADLTINQRAALNQAIGNLKKSGDEMGDVVKYAERARTEIRAKADVLREIPANKVVTYNYTDELYSTKEFADDFVEYGGVDVPGITNAFEGELEINGAFYQGKYATFDEWFDGDFKIQVDALLQKKGYTNKTFRDNIIENMRNRFKSNAKITKPWEGVSPANAPIKRPRKVGMGDETLDPKYADKYYDLIKKTGSELTDEERAFLNAIEDWKTGKEVDFENIKVDVDERVTPINEEPSPEPDINPETMDDTPSFDAEGLFNRSKEEVDLQGINDVQKLREYSANNRPDSADPDSIIINDVNNAIAKGKKLTKYSDEQIDAAFKNKGFTDAETATYKKRLQTPIKGYGFMDYFYWNIIEPMFKRWSSVLSDIIRTKFFTKIPTPQEVVNEMMPSIERVLNNFDAGKDYDVAIKELRIKFGRIRSSDPTTYSSYKKLFDEWDNYMNRELTGTSLENWNKFKNKLKSQEEGFFGSSWKKMIDPDLESAAQKNGSTWSQIMEEWKSTFKDIGKTWGSQPWRTLLKIVTAPIRKLIGPVILKAIQFVFTNFFTSPKVMEEFFITNGYAISKTKWSVNNLLGLPTASMANFVRPYLYKWIYVPASAVALYALADAIYGGIFGSSFSDMEYSEVYRMFMIDFGFGKDVTDTYNKNLENMPEWYQVIEKYGLLGEFTAPAFDFGVFFAAYTESKSEGKIKTTSKVLDEKRKKLYDDAMKDYKEKALSDYNNMPEVDKLLLQNSVYYSTLKSFLEQNRISFLTPSESKLLLSNLSFEPGPTLDVKDKVTQEVNNLDDIKLEQIQKLDISSISKIKSTSSKLKDVAPMSVVGNVLLKGKSGAKYKVVPVFRTNDPESLHSKTNDPLMKDSYAWIKPQFSQLKTDSDKTYFNLKQFVNKYENL